MPGVDGQELGRHEQAEIIATSWIWGTSREGDPQLHVHNQLARASRTGRDGQWRAIGTMSVRAQLSAVRGIATRRERLASPVRRRSSGWKRRDE